MPSPLSLLTEVEDAIANGEASRRNEILRRVTDLFIIGAPSYSDDEIDVFDDVITRLAMEIELSARVLLAERLAPVPNAPPKIIRALAFDDEIDVARPVLTQSDCLDDPTLVENAKCKGQEHMLAISRRRSLSEAVTDVLVERGDRVVALSIVENPGARFSESGFATLVKRSDGDDMLAARVGARSEIPPHLFLKLLATASQAVRIKLAAVHPHAKAAVHQVVDEVAGRIREETLARSPDYSAVQRSIEALQRSGELNDARLGAFAKAGRFEETTVALSLMCDLPLPFVEQAMGQEHSETVLILARAVGLSWSTVKAVLLMRAGRRNIAAVETAKCLANYERLKPATAQEIVAFYRRRQAERATSH